MTRASFIPDGKSSIVDIASCADTVRTRRLAGDIHPSNVPTKTKTLDAFYPECQLRAGENQKCFGYFSSNGQKESNVPLHQAR